MAEKEIAENKDIKQDEAVKKRKIFFIYPPSPVMNREDRCQQPIKDLIVIPPLPPTDLMYMAAVAENITQDKSGNPIFYEAKIKDYSLVEKKPIDEFKQDLKDFSPDYLVINVATPTYKNDLAILKIAKEILPNLTTIAKGAYFLLNKIDPIYDNKSLDFVISGEPEDTLKELLQDENPHEIKGLSYRDGFIVKYTGKRQFITDLDKLPFPARHLVNNNIFRRPDNNNVQAVIKVSRGCPHHCFFCLATPVSGAQIRKRSAENIIEEIKECVEKYNITNFLFWADIFNEDRDWTMDLCQKIIDSGLKITWSANTRADTADEEMAELMYESGCRLVSIGVESGSQFILDKIGKKITIDQVRNTVKIFKNAGIRIYNYFVIGLPWDDEDSIEDTIEFAIALDSDFISFYTATPLPGTRYYNYAKKNKLLDKNATWDDVYFHPVVKTHFLSKERILELHKEAIKRFYLRPLYILRMISKIRSWTEFKNYMKAGIGIMLRK